MRLPALLTVLLLLTFASGYHADGQQARIVTPSDSVNVVVSDWDLNANPRGVDRYEDPEFMIFRTSRDDVGEAHPDLVETGPSTGLFEFTIQLETEGRACRLDILGDPRFAAEGGSDPSVGVCPGDLLLVQYEDSRGADGRSTLVDYVFQVNSWDPMFTTDRSAYFPGDRITVDIYDPDANRDPDLADDLSDVRVFSQSDPAGKQFSAVETGRNTGLFELAFLTSLQSQGNAILVKNPDEITVRYIDDFPADFNSLQEEKKFSFVMVIGATTYDGIPILSEPELKTPGPGTTDGLFVGQQTTLSTWITSTSQNTEFPFVAIMEVRNAEGQTVSLVWHSGYLYPQSRTEVGMSWIPQEPGAYELRTFLVSEFQNPQILSKVSSSAVTVTADGN